jgi:hypothetical protein
LFLKLAGDLPKEMIFQRAAACESDCALFVNLPRLARLVKEGEPPCGYAVFSKSLESYGGQTRGTDVVRALAILESAIADLSAAPCGETGGCERLTRITTAVACLHEKPQEGNSEEGTKAEL